MVVDASSLRTNGVDDLELIFHENIGDLRTLLALRPELDRRSTPPARELRGEVQRQLVALQIMAAHSAGAPRRRRGPLWLGGFVVAGITAGLLPAMGSHLWELISRSVGSWIALW